MCARVCVCVCARAHTCVCVCARALCVCVCVCVCVCETRHLDGELELVVEFRHQQVVTQSLPHLHDPHHRRVDLILTVLEHALRRAHLLLHLTVT